MRNLAIEEIKGNKNFNEFCEFNQFDVNKITSNLGSNLSVELLDEDDEQFEDVDANYPYQIFNPFGLDIKAE
jgi:hypothetical protein